MSMGKKRHGLIAALTVAAVGSVAGCKAGGNAEADVGAAQANAPATDYVSAVEMRHFDVYQRFNMKFDEVPEDLPARAVSHDGDIRPAVMRFTGRRAGLSACSMEAIVTED